MLSGRSRVPTCLTLEPKSDESFVGYIFRLACYRSLTSGMAQLAECGFAYLTNQPPVECLQALSASASIDIARLEAITYGPPNRVWAVFMGHRVSQSALESRGIPTRRVCPACLSESPHHRAMWDLRYVAVCPVHSCLLVDTCPDCARPLQWLGLDLARCRGGHRLDLDGIEPQSVKPEDVRPTAAVYGLFGDTRFQDEATAVQGMPSFADVSPADVADFLFRLGLERMGRLRKVFSLEDPGELAWEAHVVLRRGLEAIDPWPHAFHLVLDEMRERWGNSPGRSLALCVGAVERWLGSLPADSGNRIRDAVNEYRAMDAARKMEDGSPNVTYPRRSRS